MPSLFEKKPYSRSLSTILLPQSNIYQALPTVLEESLNPLQQETDPNEHKTHTIACLTVVLLSSLLVNIFLGLSYQRLQTPTDLECVTKTSAYSPLLPAVEFEDITFDNTYGSSSAYSGDPSPDLEAAWDSLWLYGSIGIPRSKLALLNRTESDVRHLREASQNIRHSSDEPQYRAMVSVFHQLHCLNFIRQYTYLDYYRQHPDTLTIPDIFNNSFNARTHVNHCIENLRIALMCHGDVTPYFMMEDASVTRTGLKADFAPLRKCRNFDRLVGYMNTHTVG